MHPVSHHHFQQAMLRKEIHIEKTNPAADIDGLLRTDRGMHVSPQDAAGGAKAIDPRIVVGAKNGMGVLPENIRGGCTGYLHPHACGTGVTTNCGAMESNIQKHLAR